MKPETARDLGLLAKALDAIADKVLAHRPKPKSALTAWKDRNQSALDRLKAIEPEIYTEVEHVIANQYAKLITAMPS